MGTAWSININQGTREKPRLPVHLVIDKSLVWFAESAEWANLPPTTPSHNWGKPGDFWLGQIPTDEGEFVKFQLYGGDLSTPLEGTHIHTHRSLNVAERERGTWSALPLPTSWHNKRRNYLMMTSPQVKRRCSECTATPAVLDAAHKKSTFLQQQ